MSHDKELLTNVQQAVDRAREAKTDEEQIIAEKQLYDAIDSLTIIETHHPTTVVSPAYSSVKNEIVNVQAIIDSSAEDYNKQVEQLNALRSTFPYPFIAKILGIRSLQEYKH